MKSSSTAAGYKRIKLATGPNKAISLYVHRLVALAFIKTPGINYDTAVINHIDEVKYHNHYKNLEQQILEDVVCLRILPLMDTNGNLLIK